ncbi:MAG: ammonia-forming cytochrome c nitrite reductase subunit c552 [Phycisphaerales bacterium]|nr:ammonia-forming cytochrome c nitrite reductase subunit c552 [Phycisphaerales bacterium]
MTDTCTRSTPRTPNVASRSGRAPVFALILVITLLATALVTFVLVRMFENKEAARTPFVRVAEVDELTTDPRPWGANWPHQFDGWKATAGDRFYGGSSAMPESKLDQQPYLRRLYAGYAFSIDYREARGHAYMLYDQGVTERVTKKPQAGACLHCHASTTVLYRKKGLEAMGEPADDAALAAEFNMPAVRRGFEELSRQPYFDVFTELASMPDGDPGSEGPVFPMPPAGGFEGEIAGEKLPADHPDAGNAHPVTCIDCHDPKTMAIRVTRPGFMQGIAALAAGDGAAPHLPSIERWRTGDRTEPYDPNALASRQEMRSFVCGQCHVEYYCANRMTLTFPWGHGLRAEDLERYWDELSFPDGSDFFDYLHGETGTPVFKAQHPEFELWSQGIHARSGVSCSDCHMPYQRVGAMKVSNHDVRSPLAHVNAACQNCHHADASELTERVESIQAKTVAMIDRAGAAMTDMLDAIIAAKASGASDAELAEVYALQRKAMWRVDYISSENSLGFHADQEAMRILAESIDYSRRAQVAALRIQRPGIGKLPPAGADANVQMPRPTSPR